MRPDNPSRADPSTSGWTPFDLLTLHAQQRRRRERCDASALLAAQKVSSWSAVNGRCNDERRSLNLLNGVDVVGDDRVREGLIKPMGRSDEHVKAGRVKGECTGAREGVEKVERLLLLSGCKGLADHGLSGGFEQRWLGAPPPRVSHDDARRSNGRVSIEAVVRGFELTRDGCKVDGRRW